VFAITENNTDAILFIGEVQNPEYDEFSQAENIQAINTFFLRKLENRKP